MEVPARTSMCPWRCWFLHRKPSLVCLSVVSQQYGPLFPSPPSAWHGIALSRLAAVSLQISSVLEASRWQSRWLAACAAAKSPSAKLRVSRIPSRSPFTRRFASMRVEVRPPVAANRTRLDHAAPRVGAGVVMGQPIDRLYALRCNRQFRRRQSSPFPNTASFFASSIRLP